MRINYRRKSTISVKMFIAEFGESFSEHIKKRLMDLEMRCFLTRKESDHIFDLKHVEHLQYECAVDSEGNPSTKKMEYVYGQFAVIDGLLYFSERCIENNEILQSPVVSAIYNSLDSNGMIFDEGRNLKRIDDDNINFVIDSILSGCPQVSQEYTDIVQGMVSRANNK